jgi:RHS repeat-associated protein
VARSDLFLLARRPVVRRAFLVLSRPLAIASLALALVATLPLAAVGAGSTSRKAEAGKRLHDALRGEQRVGRELVGLRTRTSKTFVGRGGQKVARLYAGSVHYRNARGRWRDIDPRLQRLHGRLLNRRNTFSTSLPAAIGDDTVRIRKGRWWMAFAVRGARGSAEARGATARYREALPGVDVVYTAQRDALKEDLVLRGPASRRRFSFDLMMAGGLRPDLLTSGALALRDRRGRVRLTMAAPFMTDAARRTAPVGVRLGRAAGGWRVTYVLSSRWLDRRGRKWPVVVDPSATPNPDGDCYLDASTPESSFCAANPMKVGIVGGHDHRIVMRFPLNGIPRGVDVGGATLVAYQTNETSSTPWRNYALEPLTEPFTSAASWNRNDGTDRWSEPGGEVDAAGKAEFPGGIGGITGNNYNTMMKMVREWVSGKRPNHGMVISVPTGGNGAWLDSSESTANKPYLNVVYKDRIGDRRGWVHESQQITDRMSLGVNVGSGNLMVRQTDFSMPGGLGPAVSVSRTYNSLDDSNDSLGQWQLDTGPDFWLEQNAGGAYMRLIYPSGAKGIYDKDPLSGEYITPPGFNNTLKKDQPASGKWELTDHASQTKFRFENHTKDGRLYEIEDRNGRKLTFVYDATTNRLARIEDSNNDTATTSDDVRFTFASATQLTQMTDPAGRTYTYGYTGSLLTSYTDPQNGASFKTLYEYNGPDSKLSKITTPQGNVTKIDYHPTGHEYEGKVKTVTRVTDTATMTGPTTTFEYMLRRDGSGETRVTDPIGTATSDENDRVTRHVFDEQGRVTKTIDALGRERSRKLTSNSKVESYTAASNSGTTPNTSFGYDGDDNPKKANTPVNAGGILGCADYGEPDPASGTETEKRCDDPAPAATYTGGSYQGVPTTVSGNQYLLGRATNPQGGRTNLGYTAQGNPSSVQQTDDAGIQTAAIAMSYGSGSDGLPGQLNEITDPRGGGIKTTYGYDAKGNVNVITPPNPGAPNPVGPTRITYNQNLARVDKVQDGKDNWRLLTYDNLDRLTKIEFTGADQLLGGTEPYVQYTYDRDGNQTQEDTREEGTGTLRSRSMTYDKLNRVIFESLPGGTSNTYTYDAVGNLRSLTDGGGKVEYTYNAVNEVRAIYDPGATKPTKFEHTVDGLRSKTSYPNGATVAQTYDGAFRPSKILSKDGAGTTAQEFDYTYLDPATSRETPMIFEKVDPKLGHRHRYTYDGLDRLTTAMIKSSTGDWTTNTTLAKYDYSPTGFKLDDAGNIVKRIITGSQVPNSVTDYAYNSFNELCARQSGTTTSTPPSCPTTSPAFTYDKNGNELSSPGRTASYNLLDQTTNITISGTPTSMIYLGTGQARKISEASSSMQHNVLGLGKNGGYYFTRDDAGKLVSRRAGTERLYYFFDALGSATGFTDAAGSVITRRDYEPYGTPAPYAAGQWGATFAAGEIGQGQFGFAGGLRTVGGMYQFGQRYYDPSLMRWTQPDPLDQTGDLREGNKYLYAGGDPVNFVDPHGQAKWGGWWGVDDDDSVRIAAGVTSIAGGLAVAGACIAGTSGLGTLHCGTAGSSLVVGGGTLIASAVDDDEDDDDDDDDDDD